MIERILNNLPQISIWFLAFIALLVLMARDKDPPVAPTATTQTFPQQSAQPGTARYAKPIGSGQQHRSAIGEPKRFTPLTEAPPHIGTLPHQQNAYSAPYASKQSPKPYEERHMPNAQEQQYQKGLLAHWPFDSTSATTIVDASNQDQVGTIRGAQRVVPGVLGSALYFNGHGARVTGSDIAFPSRNSASSFSFWVNYSGKAGVIFSYGMPSDGTARGVAVLDATTVKFFGWRSDHDCIVGLIGDGRWHHLALTYNGQRVEIWADGQLSCSAPKRWDTFTGMRWIMGRNPIETYTADDFQGYLDDFRVYSRALTKDDIHQIMALTDYRPPPIRATQ